MDERLKRLAETIVNYSIDVQKNEKVLITTGTDKNPHFINYLVDLIYEKEGIPYVIITNSIIANHMNEKNTDERIKLVKKFSEFEVDNFDSFIRIVYNHNDYESKNVPADLRQKLGNALMKSSDKRVNEKKWVLLEYPSEVDSFKAEMPTLEFYNYALDAMTVDYSKMNELIKPLKELMDKTDKVRIVGPNTDLTFSIKGMGSVPCCGKMNIPDGELYSAPVKNSVNGIITYNTPCPYQGNIYHNVSLEFKDGKIIKATCDEDNDKLNEIFDTDEGARYVGEFSLGFNPMILEPMGDILYDEKILGSLHFTPGKAYKDCYNGNDSAIHWDMVLIQRVDHGGGEIYFDDVLIRKDGIFVLDELKPLNYNCK